MSALIRYLNRLLAAVWLLGMHLLAMSYIGVETPASVTTWKGALNVTAILAVALLLGFLAGRESKGQQ